MISFIAGVAFGFVGAAYLVSEVPSGPKILKDTFARVKTGTNAFIESFKKGLKDETAEDTKGKP